MMEEAAVKFLSLSFIFQAVLCQKFSIDLPQKIEALSGSCVLLPCTFKIRDGYDSDLQNDPTGIWRKVNIVGNENRYTEVFNSKPSAQNQIKGELTGDLKQKNCTTIFYNIQESNTGNYIFRIEAGKLQRNFTKRTVSINVRTSPSVTLCKEKQMKEQKKVLEGTSVTLVCSAPSSCPSNLPSFTWSFLPEEQILNQNTSFSSSTLNFRASHLHHGLNITCTITYQLENKKLRSAQSSFTLHVLYAPKNTTLKVSPSAPVLLGSSVNLSCSSDANPAVLNFTWYRRNGEQIGTGNHLIINQTDETHHGLYCRAQNKYGDQNSSIYLDLQYAPQISFSSSCNTDQTSIQCFCVVHGYPSPKLEWRLSDQTLLNKSTIQEESVSNVTLNSSISIRLPHTKAMPILQCVGTNHLGVVTQIFSFIGGAQVPDSSADAPKNTTLKVSPPTPVLLGSSVNLSCSSDANPAVLNYTWYRRNGEQIGTGNHLIINQTDETHHGLYCRAQNHHGHQNSSSYLDLQYAPQISSSCNTDQTSIQCFCVVHGYPSPKLEWRLSDQTLLNKSTIQEESVSNVTLNSSISIRLPHTKATPILQCVGTNHLGVATQIFSFIGGAQAPDSFAVLGLNLYSLLIGAAVGAAVVGVLCGLGLCIRKSQQRASQSGAGAAGLVLNDRAVLCQEYDSDSLYANKTVSSDSLHYSSINFPNGSGTQIRGLSSLTEEYAIVQNHPDRGAAKPEPLAKPGTKNQVNMDSADEEVTYGNIVRHQNTDPACPGLDVVAEIQDEQKNGSDPDQLEHSGAPEGRYAQVKPLPKV